MRGLQRALVLFLAITLAKLVLLGAFFWSGRAAPFVGDNAKDLYLPIADRLLHEGRFNGPDSRPDSKVPLGYPALLAAIQALRGPSYLPAVVAAQFLIDFGVAWVLYLLGRGIGSPRAGLLAGFFWLLYPPEILISTWITAETAFTAMVVLSVALLWRSVHHDRLDLAFWAGLALGVATLIRVTTLYFPLCFLAVWGSWEGRRGWLKGLCLAGGLACLVLPWFVRNVMVLDDPIPGAVGAGSAFLQGSDERWFTIAGKRANYPRMYQEAADVGVVKPVNGKESEIDGWLLRVGLNNYRVRVRERPLSIVPFMLHKAVRLWYGVESGSVFNQTVLGLFSLLIVPLALWQIARWWTSQRDTALLFGCVVAYFFLGHWITMPEYRYIHPLFPLLLLAACQRVMEWLKFESEPRALASDAANAP